MLKTVQILVIALCAAIFAWGLQYKLSLYNAPPPSIPAAKLLTGKTNASLEAQDDRQSSASQAAFVPFLSLLLVVGLMASSIVRLQALSFGLRDIRELGRATLDRFSFRPPPLPA